MIRRLLLLTVGASAVVLLPWTVVLGRTLPDSYTTGLWRLAWVGFDVGLIACFAVATVLGVRRHRSAVPMLCATAALLCCDAWFDVVLDWRDPGRWLSVAMAVLVELPFAALLFRYARHLLTGGMRSRTVTGDDIELAADGLTERCLGALERLAPATATRIAESIGAEPAEISTLLQRLASLGYARRGRDRRWRPAGPLDLRLPDPAALDPRMEAYVAAKFDQELNLLGWAAEHRDAFGPWGKGERATVHLTREELHSLNEEYRELLARYCQLHDARKPDTRRVAVRFYAFPLDESDDRDQPVR